MITTDSKYSCNCILVWSKAWRLNGWRTATGKQVENRDLVEEILHRVAIRERAGVATFFEWTKGHALTEGNIEADKLAVRGARAALT
jgi:ribonuclease HI